MDKSLSSFSRIYQLVAQIPYGKVATYKQLAILEGSLTPRQVGYAMANSPKCWQDKPLPWHRVINSQGTVSPRKSGDKDQEQRLLLIEEGALLINRSTVDFSKVAWQGPSAEFIKKHRYFLPF